MRLFNLVEQTGNRTATIHFQGMPPELTGGQDQRETLPWPRVLLIEEEREGIFLYRFSEDGSFGGDTWHMDLDEAKEQAEYEYEGLLGDWREIPPNVDNALTFALRYV